MENKILEFIKLYNEKYNEESEHKISFHLHATTSFKWIIPTTNEWILELDDEDIKYFYDKYSKQANNELNKKIEKLKKEYSGLI